MRRREFITLLGGAAAWPLSARAQQGERTRRVGVLMNLAADDPEGQTRIVAFVQGLQQSGWTDGRNIRIDTRWAAQAVAPSFGVELSPVGVRDAGEIERTIAAFARSSNAGMIVTASTSAVIHRHLIVMLAARHRLPAVYSFRYFATTGGLISYGGQSDRHVPTRGRLC